MLRALTVAVLLMAAGGCGGDEADPHALVACEPGWTINGNTAITHCEAGCQAPPPLVAPGTPNAPCASQPFGCRADHLFTFEGRQGCCHEQFADPIEDTVVEFQECE